MDCEFQVRSKLLVEEFKYNGVLFISGDTKEKEND